MLGLKDKKVKVFLLDVIFTVLLISLLLFVRLQSKSYFEQVQSFSEDITITEALKQAGNLINLKVLDHFIFS